MNIKDDSIKNSFRLLLISALRGNGVPEHGQGVWLADKMEVTPKAVGKWLNGESLPDQAKWPRLANCLNKGASYFYEGVALGEAIEATNKNESGPYMVAERIPNNVRQLIKEEKVKDEYVYLPYYLEFPLSAEKGAIKGNIRTVQELSFRSDWLRSKGLHIRNLYILPCHSDSMEPTISKGDIVLLDKTEDSLKNNCIYAFSFGGEALLKRVYRDYDGSIFLHCDNDAETDRKVPASEVHKLEVIGRAVWHAGDL